jgi:hypothetical protein
MKIERKAKTKERERKIEKMKNVLSHLSEQCTRTFDYLSKIVFTIMFAAFKIFCISLKYPVSSIALLKLVELLKLSEFGLFVRSYIFLKLLETS